MKKLILTLLISVFALNVYAEGFINLQELECALDDIRCEKGDKESCDDYIKAGCGAWFQSYPDCSGVC